MAHLTRLMLLLLVLTFVSAPVAGADGRPSADGGPSGDETREVPPRLLYHPSISNGVIAFSCFGDIWTVREDGSALKRITDHPGRDVHPVLSPDGSMIAFTSDRTGPYNVFVIPTTGGEATQLTWSSATAVPVTWTPDGQRVVFRGAPNGTWEPWLYTVSVKGGRSEPLPVGEAAFGTYSADGKQFAFNRTGIWDPWRKGYIGSGDSDVWVADLEAGTFEKRTDFNGPDSWPLFAPDGDIYYVSERDGVKNIYRLRHGRGEPERITEHDGPGVVNPKISPDGRTIVYQYNFTIWTVSTRGGTPKQVPITIGGEPKRELSTWVTYDSRCDEFAVRPDGKRVAVSCRGELFTVPTEKAGDRVRVTDDPGRDRVPVFSPDGTKLAFISDRSGEEHVYLHDRKTKELTEIVPPESLMAVQIWTWGNNRIAFRPDGKALAFQAGHGLYVYDLESRETAKIAETKDCSIGRSAWSPDGRWMVYSKPDVNLVEHLYVYSFDTKEERRLFDDAYGEWNPVFTPDGKYLVFVGRRELDGDDQYDREGRSWVQPEVYALALQPEKADPDEPKDPDAEEKAEEKKEDKEKDKTDGDGESGGDAAAPESGGDVEDSDNKAAEATDEKAAEAPAAGEQKTEEPAKEEEKLRVEISFDNVEQRIRRLTQMVEGVWSPLLVTPDSQRVIFGVNEPRGRERADVIYSARIERTKDPGENLKEVARLNFWNVQLAEGGQTIYVLDGGQVKKVPAGGGGATTIEFSLRFAVDLRAEMRQMYLEAWRALRDGFYDETMHGKDWLAARQKYEPFLGSVVDKQEVMDLIIEMIGELNASHCGAWTGGSDRPWAYEDSRRLGLELKPDDASGLYRVSHVYQDGAADKSWLDLKEGDYIFSIEGNDVRAGDDYERFLINPLNDKVTLRVGREPDAAKAHDVRIAHIGFGDERQRWYDEWVERNERYVEEQTGGRVGYLHIQGMNGRSLAKFKKDLLRVRDCDGLIIDVRHNGGGLIDDVLLDILNRRAYNITRSRGASTKRLRPEDAFYGVKAVLIDSSSYSDAEMFPDGFRRLGHGKLVGEPTNGSVIGTGGYDLVDGSAIRMPIWGIWTTDGKNLENYGVPPDLLVEHTPLDDLKRKDSQLDAAIKEVVSEIEAKGERRE